MSIVPTSNLRTPRPAGKFVIFVIGFACALLLLMILAQAGIPAPFLRHAFGEVHFGMDQPTVVQRIQKLQRLESVKYTLEKVVTGQRESRFLPQSLAGERILLVVHGEVFAGVDLGKLKSSDVDVKGKQVRITLPRPEVF
jgi:hypothetical protein